MEVLTQMEAAGAASRRFNEILEPPGMEEFDAGEAVRRMERGFARRRCFFAGRPVPVFAKPYFLGARRMAYYGERAGLLIRALEKVARLYFEQPETRPLFGLRPSEAFLAELDPAPEQKFWMARLDALPTADGGMKVIEFNTDGCRGNLFADLLAETIEESVPFQTLAAEYHLSHPAVSPGLLAAQLRAYRLWGGKKEKPNFAIALATDLSVFSEPELLAEWYQRQGYRATVSDLRDFEYRAGTLYDSEGEPVDIVYRRGSILHWTDHLRQIGPLVEAVRDRAVCVVNPLSAVLGDHKPMVGVLQRPDLQPLFSAAEQQAIRENLPWTRVVVEENADYHGEAVDLVDFIRTHQEDLVLKPANLFGGRDVTIGRFVDSFTWTRAVELALQHRHVVQEYVPVPETDLPSAPVGAGKIVWVRRFANFGLFCIDHDCKAGVVRVSDQPVTNISQGGGLIPMTVVHGPARMEP